MIGIPLWLLIPVVTYITGFVVVARVVMPYVQRSIRARAREWDVSTEQIVACERMTPSDFWWVASLWPLLAGLWLTMKITGLFGSKA